MMLLDDAGARGEVMTAGFAWEPPHRLPRLLPSLLPFRGFTDASRCQRIACGELDGRRTWICDHSHQTSEEDRDHPGTHHVRTTSGSVIAIEHRDVQAAASIVPDWKGAPKGSLVDALLWIPPFTFVKAFQALAEAANPDRRIGSDAFDRRFVVRAASEEAARAAIPAALGELLVDADLGGALELRPGWILIEPKVTHAGADAVKAHLDLARRIAAALTREPAGAYR